MSVLVSAICLLVGLSFGWLPRHIFTSLLIGLVAYAGTLSMINAGYSRSSIATAAAITLAGIGISCGTRICLAVKSCTALGHNMTSRFRRQATVIAWMGSPKVNKPGLPLSCNARGVVFTA